MSLPYFELQYLDTWWLKLKGYKLVQFIKLFILYQIRTDNVDAKDRSITIILRRLLLIFK